MKPIPILGVGIQSRNNNVTAQKRINVYMESTDDRQSIVAYSTPGTALFKKVSDYKIRGIYYLNEYLYVIANTSLYRIDKSGNIVLKGTFTTNSGPVDISDNGVQMIIVDNLTMPLQYGYQSGPGAGRRSWINIAGFYSGCSGIPFSDQ